MMTNYENLDDKNYDDIDHDMDDNLCQNSDDDDDKNEEKTPPGEEQYK